jgi:ABC-type anion transport system duplicated permease subunit
VTGFTGHDRDQDLPQTTPLFSIAQNFSLEWSTDWIAVLIAASFPFGYDGITQDENGYPRSAWRFLPWTVSLGIAVAPF